MYAIAVMAVAAGCNADDPRECPGKMTLVGETGVQADLDNGEAFGEQLPGMVDTFLDEIGVGRKPHLCAKEPHEVKFAEAGGTRQFGEGDVFGKTGIKVFEGGLDGTVCALSGGEGCLSVRVAGYHACQDG